MGVPTDDSNDDERHVHSPNPRPIAAMKQLAKDFTAFNMSDEDALGQQQQEQTHALADSLEQREEEKAYNEEDHSHSPPPSLLSPAFTPPSTPGGISRPQSAVNLGNPAVPMVNNKIPKSTAVDTTTSLLASPKLLDTLPTVTCIVRARIPTTIEASGQEMFLHCYQNSIDNKEHMAIVFGDRIRSTSLYAPRKGETELDRMTRGAYDGRLHPGRKTSRLGQAPSSASTTTTTHDDHVHDADDQDELDTPPLVRIHSECYTGETVWSARCDCGEQLDEAARLMSMRSSKGGVIIYLRQEGRGIGLSEKLKAYNLQDLGSDTVEANLLLRHPADARTYGLATAMLIDLGLGGDRGIKLLTNNPDKVRAVEGPKREVRVRERVEMVPISWRTGGANGVRGAEVGAYLRTKIEKMGHMLSMNQ